VSSYFFRLCWKNIWRNKRRTLITVNAIGLGVMALVFLRNYYDTFHEQVIHNVIKYHSGHLAISARDFEKNNATQLFISDADNIKDWLKTQTNVSAFSERVLFSGLASSARGSSNLTVMAVDPNRESKVTSFAQRVTQGTFLGESKNKSIVLGSKAAAKLSAELGSKIVLLTQGVDGSVGNELFYVDGIFETGSEADKSLALIRIKDGQAMLSLGEKSVHQLAMTLKNEELLSELKDSFESQFSKDPKVQILSWKELQRPVVAMIELDSAVNRMLMILILCVAALGIANSILMSLMERTREFGVMLAIGTARRDVVKMVIVETLLLTLVGVLLGNIFGSLVTLFFNQVGFDLRWLTSKDFVIQGAVVQTISYPIVRAYNSVVVTTVIVVLALLVSYFPARHAGRLTPMKALRSH
jgi:ABC-type lipoprotein release transport system permease subunit